MQTRDERILTPARDYIRTGNGTPDLSGSTPR
jgi:hypothetical protein